MINVNHYGIIYKIIRKEFKMDEFIEKTSK